MSEENAVKTNIKESLPPKINVMVSADKMAAYVRVTLVNKEQTVEKHQIIEALNQKKIEYGILHEEIEKFCRTKNYYGELNAAKGLRPIKGADGSIEFNFKKSMSGMAVERDDGTLDFKKLDLIQNVSKGDILCTITLPLEGTDGIDIFGNAVSAQKGDMPLIPSGDKIVISEDSKFIYANADGGISYKNGVISIEDIYIIKKDVGPSTGNVDFNGSIVVHGNVLEGFSIKADKDITVQGMVEGSALSAGGSILVKGGISGMKKALITAQDNIVSTFIENATVKCGKDVLSDVILNANISAGGSIILKGKKGTMIGGIYKSGEKVSANIIGNSAHVAQSIIIDPCFYEMEKLAAQMPQEDLAVKKQQLWEKRKKLSDFLEKEALEKHKHDNVSANERKRVMQEALTKKVQIKSIIAQIDEELAKIDPPCHGSDFKVIGFGEIFPGTKIVIGNAKMKVNASLQNQKFYLNDGEIAVSTVLPGERY